MSSVFLACYEPNSDSHLPLTLLDEWIPFVSTRQSSRMWHLGQYTIRLRAWSVLEDSARGSYWTWPDQETQGSEAGLCFQGWVREPDEEPLSLTVAQVLKKLCRQGQSEALGALHQRPGQFCGVYIDPEYNLHGFADAFCGQHLYYAYDGARTLVSNRASLIAAYLDGIAQQNRGISPTKLQPRRPDSLQLGWLLTRYESLLGDHMSAWSEIKLLMPGQRLQANQDGPQLKMVSMPTPHRANWDELTQDLIWRAGQLKRLPKVPFQLALTGGFDSRLILGALFKSGSIEQVKRIYLHATKEQADYKAAQQLADHYGLNLEVQSAVDAYRNDSFLSQVPRHSFMIEYLINAWDLKSGNATLELPNYGSLPGHFGELYRSHGKHVISHSHRLILLDHLRLGTLNKHKVLGKEASRYYQSRAQDWLAQQKSPSSLVLDDLHREARMWRWAGHTQMYESLGYPSINLLPDLKLRAGYAQMSLADRLKPTVHFELMRRMDENLAWLPFAKHQWPKSLTKVHNRIAPPPIKGAGNELNRQIHMWRREQEEICAYLMDHQTNRAFFELIDHQALIKRIQFVKNKPTPQHVKGLLATAAIRFALENDLKAYPLA